MTNVYLPIVFKITAPIMLAARKRAPTKRNVRDTAIDVTMSIVKYNTVVHE